jgi:large subunit ribosomal protein L6
MSRIGKNPINIPAGVDVKVQGASIAVKGPKGNLSWEVPHDIKVAVQDKSLTVERLSDSKAMRGLHGTARSIIANMVTGVSAGYQRLIEIRGVGYRAQVQGSKIIFTIGYSHPVEFPLPSGISAEVDKKQVMLTLQGVDKQLIGQVAANIRSLRSPDIYKGKGIRYDGEHIKLKAGKAGKK